jgi:hypothetical protein
VRAKTKNDGFVLLLGLLLVVVIGAIMYYSRISSPGFDIATGGKIENPPWQQWHKLQRRLEKDDLGELDRDQPPIKENLIVEADVFENKKDRGSIYFGINKDMTIQGQWTGEFWADEDIEHQVMMCDFKGYLDPQQTFEDENGEDYSKLYMLTKGRFMILESNDDNGKVRNVSGYIFITAWMDADYNIKGNVVLTSDEKHCKTFDFSTKPKEGRMAPINTYKSLF